MEDVDESQVAGMVMIGVGDGFDKRLGEGGDGLGSEDPDRAPSIYMSREQDLVSSGRKKQKWWI